VETTKLGSRTEWTRAADRRAARLTRADELVDRVGRLGAADLGQPLRQLARGPARHVGLAGVGVVDDLPVGRWRAASERRGLAHRGGQREVAGRDHADAALARGRVDLREVLGGQPGAADDDRTPARPPPACSP
jgi:hypothetical protein